MTIVINLYGGPSIGKSTTAAEVFFILKRFNVSCELVTEYVKEWAYEKRPIRDFDQLYFFGQQSRRETRLFDRVGTIITDSPVMLCGFYMSKYGLDEMREHNDDMVGNYYRLCKLRGHKHIHVMLKRTKPFHQEGRYEDEETCIRYDTEIFEYIKRMLDGECVFEAVSAHDVIAIALQQGVEIPKIE